MSQILIIGASGQVGSELAKLLSSQGQDVRKATSKAASAADQVHLNLVTGEGLEAAFQGVEKAFFSAGTKRTLPRQWKSNNFLCKLAVRDVLYHLPYCSKTQKGP